jgi:peptidoglycan hydrolase CwlO-like protein
VTYRDDHEAALARAEALQRQLDEAREKADEAAAEAREAHAEKARLEDELADLRDVQQERTAERAGPVEAPGPALTAPPAGSYLQPPTETLPETVEPAPPEPFAAGQLGLVIALLLAVLLLAMYAAP